MTVARRPRLSTAHVRQFQQKSCQHPARSWPQPALYRDTLAASLTMRACILAASLVSTVKLPQSGGRMYFTLGRLCPALRDGGKVTAAWCEESEGNRWRPLRHRQSRQAHRRLIPQHRDSNDSSLNVASKAYPFCPQRPACCSRQVQHQPPVVSGAVWEMTRWGWGLGVILVSLTGKPQ